MINSLKLKLVLSKIKAVWFASMCISSFLLIPSLSQGISSSQSSDLWQYKMINTLDRGFTLFKDFSPTSGYKERQNIYLEAGEDSNGFYAQSSRIYARLEANEEVIIDNLAKIYAKQDCCDFRMNGLLRMLYINMRTNILTQETKDQICDALGKAKYWFTYPGEDTAIFTTENHQILYHTAEYLAGQLFPDTVFENSGLTGEQHVEHAKPLILRWLGWKSRFGFSEYHSNTYYVEDVSPLVNLVDFAIDEEIALKAAMILDVMAFDFANNYFKGDYAVPMGRCYDGSKVGIESWDSVADSAWLMLGMEEAYREGSSGSMAAVALATSDNYAPPPILEKIYQDARLNHVSKERLSMNVNDGPEYGIPYNEENLMFYYALQGQMHHEIIELTYEHIEKHDRDPMTVSGPQILFDALKIAAAVNGLSVGEYAKRLDVIFRGICLESVNSYAYRTPYYQLAGAQDYAKGLNSAQEHIWQATLSKQAYVFTNSPGGYVKDLDQKFMGGFKPRATLYKNIGVIQYDRETADVLGEIGIFGMNMYMGGTFYQHAYFPKNAFDEVNSVGSWTFGKEGDSYIGLYSYEPTTWASDFELRVNSRKNVWIVELGSKSEHGSYDDFKKGILNATLQILPERMGYDVSYKSFSQGPVSVDWDSPMMVDGSVVDLGPYDRFENKYCNQKFGANKTIMSFGSHKLELDFESGTRTYIN